MENSKSYENRMKFIPKMKIQYVFLLLLAIPYMSSASNIDTTLINKQVDSLIFSSNMSYEQNDLINCIKERESAVLLLKKIGNWNKLVAEYNTLNVAFNLADDPIGAGWSLDSAFYYSSTYLAQTDVEYIYTMSNMGYKEYLLTNYEKCIEYNLKALNSYEKIEAHPSEYFSTLKLLLLTYRRKGRIVSSNQLAEKYLNIFKTNYSINKLFLVELQLVLGVNHFENSNLDQAFKVFESAIKECDSIKNSLKKDELILDLKSALSRVYLEYENPNKALEMLESVDMNSIKSKDLINDYYYNLGSVYLYLKNYEKAVANYKQAYESHLEINIRMEKVLSNYSSFIAESYLKQNQLDSAMFYLDSSLNHLGYKKKSNIDNFHQYSQLTNFNVNNIMTLCRAGELYSKSFRKGTLEFASSSKFYSNAFNGAKFLQKELNSKHSKYILNKNLQEHFPGYLSLLLELHSENQSPEIYEEILQLIEDNKSMILKEDVQEKLALSSSTIPEDLIQKEEDIKVRLNNLNRNIHEYKNKEGADQQMIRDWEEEHLKTTQEYAAYQKDLENKFPDYYKAKYTINTIKLADLKTHLSKSQTFLNFYETEENWYCAWVSKTQEGIHIAEKTEENKEALSHILKRIRTNPLDNFTEADMTNFKQKSHLLYETLIPNDVRSNSSFVISQIGQLYNLPFEILLSSDAATANTFAELPYLLKEKDIQYASSAELWIASKNSKTKNTTLNAVSFAPFTEGETADERTCLESARSSALKCTKDELEAISNNLTSTSFFSKDASLENFKTMDKASIIHLATHACLDDEDESFSKLIFYDDYLPIQDLEAMNLSADLAVLSACNTGVGKMKAGEGAVHLGKAFRAAGVSSLVTSLWSINDCTTSDIVSKFYNGLKKKDISSALRSAKLEYLQDANKLMAHPYYWAGLTFTGDANALIQTSSGTAYIPYLIACLAIILGFFFYRQRN